MKKVFITLLSALLIVPAALLAATCVNQSDKTQQKGKKVPDFAKILSMQAQQTSNLPPLTDVDSSIVDIRYITKTGTIETRKIHIFAPSKVKKPMPVVYIPHYEMKSNSLEMREYLKEGWAVVSCHNFSTNNNYNGLLTDDDLVFNNAALYAVRHNPQFDPERIVMVGGSCGGYTSMMLSGLQMGTCAAIALAPPENVYFEFFKYYKSSEKINGASLLKFLIKSGAKLATGTEEEKANALADALMEMPLPFLGITAGMFKLIQENFPDTADYNRWAALSPIGLTESYSSPFLISHCTSDLLVPIDQTTRRFTYAKNSDNMPKGFSTRLPKNFAGILGKALDELLDTTLTHVEAFTPPAVNGSRDIPYNKLKPFNIIVTNDGPVENFSSHNNGFPVGTVSMIPFLKDKISQGLAKTEFLRPGKLELLLNRYAGKSIQLPAHQGIDDTAYGSLIIYQKEIVEELQTYVRNNSMKSLESVANQVIDNDPSLKDTWKTVRKAL